MKCAIVGSRQYENVSKIKNVIFELKRRFGDDLTIISGGAQNGADKYARKFALEFGISYIEFNPAHTPRNLYSAMPDTYYSKPYHPSQFFHRNTLIARNCDMMIAFMPKNVVTSGTKHAISEAIKYNKKVIIVN